MTLRAIIDTDPGIDDAIAILLALADPGLEILAITTVAGNIGLETTTRNALRILALCGHRVPVHPGAAACLSAERAAAKSTSQEDSWRIHGRDGLGGVTFPDPLDEASRQGAVEAMVRLLDGEPAGSIDIFALGPLTNIARLILVAPDAARRVRRLIAMGGAVDEPGNVGPRSEFNLAHDPEAAAIVLAAGLPLTLIPLDVTRRVRADRAFLARLAAFGTPASLACRALIEAYFATTKGGESRPLHDPCVPLLALAAEHFETRRLDLQVDLAMDSAAGALLPGVHPVNVAMGVDAPAVLERMADILRRGR